MPRRAAELALEVLQAQGERKLFGTLQVNQRTEIKTMQRQAYGFRDYELFKLKIHPLHESTYALVG